MKAIDKNRLENLLRRVIGRPENVPAPPAPKSHRPAVLPGVYAPYRCAPTNWGTPVVAAPPAYGRPSRPPAPETPAPEMLGSPSRGRSRELAARPAPPPRGLLT